MGPLLLHGQAVEHNKLSDSKTAWGESPQLSQLDRSVGQQPDENTLWVCYTYLSKQ